jgi:sigma-B regulation protein RsbU (phosphoserine phosphatase)
MLKNKSLFVKLSLSVLTCTFLILSAITLNTYFVAKNILIKDVKENARTLSDATACGIDKVFITASGAAKSLALYMENSEFNEKKLERVMRKTLDAHPEVFGCCIAFKPGDTPVKAERFAPFCWRDKGGTSFTDLGKDNYQYEYRDWYQITAITGEDVWMEPYYDEGGGNIIMSTYSYPFYKKIDGKKQFAGVITADISLHWLQKLVSGIKTIKNGYGFLISKNGTIVTHPDVSQIMNQTIFSISEEINSPELRATGRNMIAGKSGFIPHKCLLYNRPCRLSYTPLRETGWSLGIIFPEKELFMPLSKLNRDTAFFSISGIIVILIVVLYISHKITRPLHELAGAAEAVGKGDFSSPLPELKTGDEIGTLSRSFNSMQKKLAEYIENL